MTPLLNSDQVAARLRDVGSGRLVHLVGAGGCGMSGLGHLLLDLGFQVSGSDLAVNDETRQLQSRGARIFRGHAPEHVDPASVLVVYTSAVNRDHPELQAAMRSNIPTARRAALLAALVHRQQSVCVAGMHGKTTTTALLAFALDKLGVHPSYAVGALVEQLVPHARFQGGGADRLFVFEADESDGTLNEFRPEHAIVLNIDADHLDYFAHMDAIMAEFGRLADRTSGHLIFCGDDPRLAALLTRNGRAVSYGRHPLASYRAEPEESPPTGYSSSGVSDDRAPGTRFQVWHQGQLLGSFSTGLLGEQNILNATAAIALLHKLGFSPAQIAGAIAPFRGAARRQQELYRDDRFRIFEDYGHHPNEIRATLRAFKSVLPKRLLVVFQPHRYTRTQHLWREFATCFREADCLWLAELYPASEPAIPGISSGFLAEAIRAEGQSVEGVGPLSCLGNAILAALRPGDLVLFLGAGDITRLAHDFVADLKLRAKQLMSGADALDQIPMKTQLYTELLSRVGSGSIIRADESLARRTTLRVGGKADLYAEPASEADLAAILQFGARHSLPVIILGRGSNLLIRDGGIRGLVICLAHEHFSKIDVVEDRLCCGAGARLKAVAVEARRHALTGLEFLEGIPGSVGGAMRMNAGAMGNWLFDVVESIRFMDFSGRIQERNAAEVNVEYRGCPLFRDHIALGAVLKGQKASKEAIQSRMDSFSRKRWDSQPHQPSAGCIFKNPGAIPAGRLIDELGLKGTRVGGAVVSDVHANFIVNDGTATARDVLSLIDIIKERARAARGIELETEVQILGEG